LEALETIIPSRKKNVHAERVYARPKISDKAPIGSWKTAELNRKLVPVQKASIAEPWRLSAMI
jgi:hypothetical protein